MSLRTGSYLAGVFAVAVFAIGSAAFAWALLAPVLRQHGLLA